MNKLQLLIRRLRYPESIWYGGSLKRKTALASVGKGWSRFINNLYECKPKHTKVQQVKEKYGGLRFYISSAPDWYFDLIDYYEEKSYRVCEKCGESGKLRKDLSWMLTLCDQHYKEILDENKNG